MNVKEKAGASLAFYDPPLPESTFVQVRQVLYRLLGSLFMYPTAERISKIQAAAGALQQERELWTQFLFGEALERLLAHVATLDSREILDLEEEFSRLFQVKPAAVPYESFYTDREGLARGLIAAHIDGEYREAGLELAVNLILPPDHIAVEMEFMAFLCDREVEALSGELPCETSSYRDRQYHFLNKHFRRWFPHFAQKAKAAEPAPLYLLTLEATFAFLHHELALFGLHTIPQKSRTGSHLIDCQH
jgi:TorA maturation chaperone TorD